MGLFFSAFVVGLAVALVFGLVVESCIGILPGDSTALSPFGGADDPEIFNIGGYALGFKINIEKGSADTEEHPVIINPFHAFTILEESVNMRIYKLYFMQ